MPNLTQVARKALKNLLSASPDLLSAAIDRCYETDASVSNQYFHVCRRWSGDADE